MLCEHLSKRNALPAIAHGFWRERSRILGAVWECRDQASIRKMNRIVESCPNCGEAVDCGMRNGDESCWCFELPHVAPMPAKGSGARCYCSACLKRWVDERRGLDQGEKAISCRNLDLT